MKTKPLLWSKEYQHAGIPSSYLKNPSGAMDLLYDYVARNDISLISKTAADIGCGRGRNTISLLDHNIGKVYAIDFVPQVIESLIQDLGDKKHNVQAICQNLTLPWPIPTNSLDIILDIFVFKHQTDLTKQEFYKKEINRTLKPNGLLLISLSAVDDGFYGIQPKVEVKPNVFKVIDPATKVGSLLYTKESLLAEFPNFELIKFENTKKEGQMHGQTYLRSTLKFLLKHSSRSDPVELDSGSVLDSGNHD